MYTYVNKNAAKNEIQMHHLNKSPITWVFDNMELYLYITCKPNGDSTIIIQSRSFSRREATSTFLTNTLKTGLLGHRSWKVRLWL